MLQPELQIATTGVLSGYNRRLVLLLQRRAHRRAAAIDTGATIGPAQIITPSKYREKNVYVLIYMWCLRPASLHPKSLRVLTGAV
jgi:hypothetical protein